MGEAEEVPGGECDRILNASLDDGASPLLPDAVEGIE